MGRCGLLPAGRRARWEYMGGVAPGQPANEIQLPERPRSVSLRDQSLGGKGLAQLPYCVRLEIPRQPWLGLAQDFEHCPPIVGGKPFELGALVPAGQDVVEALVDPLL